MHRSLRRGLPALALLGLSVAPFAAAQEPTPVEKDDVLRVCADPDNLPLSNDRGEGYENKIAEALAKDLGRRVEYTFFPQRIGFVRNTLRARDEQTRRYKCDLIVGVPKGYELTATTRPYMRSTYALIFRPRPEFEGLQRAEDLLKLPRATLESLRIGLFTRSPGADWLLRHGLLQRAVVYQAQSGDPHENPMLVIDRELGAGRIDAAIVWGPIAGYLVTRHEGGQAAWRAVAFESDPHIKFDFEISMGVRYGEKEWRDTVDRWIGANRRRIDEILTSYGIPLLDENGKVVAGFRTNGEVRAGGAPDGPAAARAGAVLKNRPR